MVVGGNNISVSLNAYLPLNQLYSFCTSNKRLLAWLHYILQHNTLDTKIKTRRVLVFSLAVPLTRLQRYQYDHLAR